MRQEVDWDSVWGSLPSIMGLNLRLIHGKYYGKYRLDGSPHDRWDKMVIKKGARDNQPIILEQGGDSCTLWTWLIEYGHLTRSQTRQRLLGAERSDIVLPDQEYIGPSRFVDPWLLIEQGGMDRHWYCPLFGYLSGLFGTGKVSSAFKRYNVSTGLKHPKNGVLGTRFWFIDMKGNICHDKTMFYGPDGHRLKDCPPMRMFKKRNGYTHDCFFGEDSLVRGRPVFVVESEKTAIICHLEYPDYNWVASAGKNCLSQLDRLSDYNVYLCPDVDAAEEWSQYGKVWDWWNRCGEKVENKWDIGDLICKKVITLQYGKTIQ